jgi:hypothetical protein
VGREYTLADQDGNAGATVWIGYRDSPHWREVEVRTSSGGGLIPRHERVVTLSNSGSNRIEPNTSGRGLHLRGAALGEFTDDIVEVYIPSDNSAFEFEAFPAGSFVYAGVMEIPDLVFRSTYAT